MKRQMDALRTELTALEACLDESERVGSYGIGISALNLWALNEEARLSLEKPSFPSDESFLLFAYQTLNRLYSLIQCEYFNTDKELSFHEALRKELIRLEDTPFSEDMEREQVVETDIRMLKRSMDILKEFDRFIERIGGYE